MSNLKQTDANHIVTGFDANYIHKAIVYYNSLIKTKSNFVLHAFCFDDVAYKTLEALDLKNMQIYTLEELEDDRLRKVRESKKRLYEYYWTCNPAMLKKVMDSGVEVVTLSDCDLVFYDRPEVILEELGEADILIQPNNFSLLQVNDFVPVGYYCTSFQVFRNNSFGKKIVSKWLEQCIEWCSSTFDRNQFGDQKYLEDWRIDEPARILEVVNPGANVAPWNIHKFSVSKTPKGVVLNNKFPLIYYHFHSFKVGLDDTSNVMITGDRNNVYEISKKANEYIYEPYIKEIRKVLAELKEIEHYSNYVQDNPEGNYHTQA